MDEPRVGISSARPGVVVANGRAARFYMTGDFVLAVTYHRRIGKRTRPLTVSPKLMAKVLR